MTAIQKNRQQPPFNQFPIIFGNRQTPMKIEKVYQTSVTNENVEPGKQDIPIDPVFYNVHHEFSFNDGYDKNYDDYQNYGDEISDNIMGKANVNFINSSIPLVTPKFKTPVTVTGNFSTLATVFFAFTFRLLEQCQIRQKNCRDDN